MTSILVTGGTGTLGRPTVALLRAAGHDVRSLSRRSGPGLVTGDLVSGTGIREAVEGTGTVLHLATGKGRNDVAATRTLLRAARDAGVAHLVFISIVGIDDLPLGYYRDKVTIEGLIAQSSLPYTILRATQFHSFVEQFFTGQRFSPVLLAPALPVQPIAVEEVAQRLVGLAETGASGRVPDMGGPERRTVPDLAHAWVHATGSRRRVWPLRLPGRAFAAFAAGKGLVPGPGHVTFEDYLASRYGVTV